MKYEDLLDHYKTQVAIADALGYRQPSVSYWKKNGIPRDTQIDIEEKTNGAFKADLPQSIRTESVTAQQN